MGLVPALMDSLQATVQFLEAQTGGQLLRLRDIRRARPYRTRRAPEIPAQHTRPAAVRLQQTQQQAQRRGLAGAVASDQPVNRAALDLQVEFVHRHHAVAEGFGQAVRFNDRGVHAHLRVTTDTFTGAATSSASNKSANSSRTTLSTWLAGAPICVASTASCRASRRKV